MSREKKMVGLHVLLSDDNLLVDDDKLIAKRVIIHSNSKDDSKANGVLKLCKGISPYSRLCEAVARQVELFIHVLMYSRMSNQLEIKFIGCGKIIDITAEDRDLLGCPSSSYMSITVRRDNRIKKATLPSTLVVLQQLVVE